MKRSIASLFFHFSIACLAIFLLSFVPQVEQIANTKSDHLSAVQAQQVNNLGEEKPGCTIFSYYDKFEELNNEINKLYQRGYRLKEFSVQLKEFSVQQTRANTTISEIHIDYGLKAFAVVCKD